MSKPDQLSRRRFMGKSAVASAAVPLFVSSRVLAQPGKPGANDRIQLGLIGAGGMGRGNLRNCTQYDDIVVTGVCEVWKERRHATIAEHEGKPKPYNDYRELLQQKDVDAVIIASPPHYAPPITLRYQGHD